MKDSDSDSYYSNAESSDESNDQSHAQGESGEVNLNKVS